VLFLPGIVAGSLAAAIVYGALFQTIYRQPIDAAAGTVFFLLGFLTVLAGLGLVRLVLRLARRA
jgi:hypothetical protein